MNKPSPVIINISPQVIKITSRQIENKADQQDREFKNSNQLVNDDIQITSNISNTKRRKMPESMKVFLKDRKYIRQINTNLEDNNTSILLEGKKQKNNQVINSFQSHSQEHYVMKIQDLLRQHDSSAHIQQKLQFKRPPTGKKQRQSSRKSSMKIFVCSICEGQLTETNKVKAFSCRHIFCYQCIQSYIKYKINMFEQSSCPQQACTATLNTETNFFKAFSKRQRRLYKQIHSFYITQTNPLMKLCPKQQCQGIIELKQNLSKQFCSSCKTNYCSNCFLQFHEGPCRDFQTKFIEDTLHYRQCSKCHIVVERIDGCNHITCKCGYQFCYICGGKWQHDHLCRPVQNDFDDGCDWGESWEDHFVFLLKLPFKIILITIYTCFWFTLSFAAAPYNIFFFLYWIILIFIGGPIVYIFEEQRKIWKYILLFLIFPFLMIYCLRQGLYLFSQRFQQQCPYISEGYRCMVRI